MTGWWAALSLSGTAGQSLVPFTQGLRPQELQRGGSQDSEPRDGRRLAWTWGTSLPQLSFFRGESAVRAESSKHLPLVSAAQGLYDLG